MDLQVFKFKDIHVPCRYDCCVAFINIKLHVETCGVYIHLLQKGTRTVAISFEFLIFCEKLEDIT